MVNLNKYIQAKERDEVVTTYGKKTYVSKLVDLFSLKSNNTSEFWLEVQ